MRPDLPPDVAAVPPGLGGEQPIASGTEETPVGGARRAMVPPMPGSVFWGWAGPLLVTALGAFLRFNRLSIPKAVVFDETYYVGDAWGILKHGVEINPVGLRKTGSRALLDRLLAHGSTHILAGTQGELVAHPPLGKEMIAVGEWLFGLTPFGWRFSVALIGSLSVLLLARIVRRMTRSTLLGCVAGLLMALDGLEFVLSRTAILDIFVMFWVLAAFGCLVIDRDRARARIAAAANPRSGLGTRKRDCQARPAARCVRPAHLLWPAPW
jgi:dolichyl-phosphate-mannose-protein mannosyltransferase